MARIIGIDCGTQSTKVLVYDLEQSQVVARAQAPHDLKSGADGSREQEPTWWLDALRACFHSIPPGLKEGTVAIGVSGQQHGLVALGTDLKPLFPAKLWNDTSTVAECELLHEALGGRQRAIALAGNPILPGYTASKVLWLKRHHADLYRRLDKILLPHDYLNHYLTGEVAMEEGDASGTGFLDIRTRSWSVPILEAMDPERDLRECLPPLRPPGQALGRLTRAAAADLGLDAGILVGGGGGDNMMGAVGTGCVAPGDLTLSLGTSGTLYAFSDTPIIAPEEEFAAFLASTGGFLPLLCTMNCTAATELVRGLIQLPLEGFDPLLATAAAGADGIVALPFFDGERSPNLPRGRGVFFGMSSTNTTRANLLRAVIEAVAHSFKGGLGAMSRSGLKARAVKAIGGGSGSKVWRDILASVLNLPIRVPREPESAAFGAALHALWCLEGGDPAALGRIVAAHVQFKEEDAAQPDPNLVRFYEDHHCIYQRHLEVVASLYP